MAMTFRVELVWEGDTPAGPGQSPCSIYLTKDGRVVLRGRAVSAEERREMDLPADEALISVDHGLIKAIKEML